MAAVAFPDLVPSTRTYTPGAYPQKQFQALNGAVTTLRYGNRRFDSKLQLGFQNVTDDNAASILSLYESVTLADDWVTFTSSNGSGGASADLASYLQETGGSGLHWRFESPPQVTSVKPGRSSVEISMVGRLDPA